VKTSSNRREEKRKKKRNSLIEDIIPFELIWFDSIWCSAQV
jgi:hypothetical protein